MGYAILAFVVIFLLAGSGLLLLFYRETLGQRLAEVLSPRANTAGLASGRRPSLAERLQFRKQTESLAAFAASFRKADEARGSQASTIRQRLVLAGYRGDSAVNIFSACKAITPVILCAASVVTGLYHASPFLVIVLTLGLGYLVPDYWLDRRIKAREDAMRTGLPDLLDLLVVCLEAGLSLDHAALRSSEEMRLAHPVIADEIGLVMLEVQAGRPRLEAWKSLANRSGVDSVRMLVSVLVQADQFGTAISKTLRSCADTLRTRRRHRVEEVAAKATVKLVFPLVLFIFPSLLIVLLGSAVISFSEAFAK
jgi:tight adherence protein C